MDHLHRSLAEILPGRERAQGRYAERQRRRELQASLTREGRAAFAAGRHAEALAVWTRLRAVNPDFLPAIEGVTRALLALGRTEEAERWAAAERGVVPEVVHAVLAQTRKDWPLALARWRALRRRGLDRPRVTLGIANALLRTGRASEAADETAGGLERGHDSPMLRRVQVAAEAGRLALEPHASPPPPEPDPAALQALLGEFQSLGRNCEFGLLQRRFGAEPLGLLRFGTTAETVLTRMLTGRFAGVGDPAQTEVRLIEDEYHVRDTEYRFGGHTRIRAHEASPEEVHRKQSQRLGFLARMMVDQLETQSRIFVYASPDCTEPQMAALYRGVSLYGPNSLLCVRLAESDHPPGSVAVQDGLTVGYIDRPGRDAGKGGWDISADHWLVFCRAARERHVARTQAARTQAELVPA